MLVSMKLLLKEANSSLAWHEQVQLKRLMNLLPKLRKKYRDATHNTFAYTIGKK